MTLVEERRKMRRNLMQASADLTHRPGNKLSRLKTEKKSYKKISKLDANLNRGNTIPNESTNGN